MRVDPSAGSAYARRRRVCSPPGAFVSIRLALTGARERRGGGAVRPRGLGDSVATARARDVGRSDGRSSAGAAARSSSFTTQGVPAPAALTRGRGGLETTGRGRWGGGSDPGGARAGAVGRALHCVGVPRPPLGDREALLVGEDAAAADESLARRGAAETRSSMTLRSGTRICARRRMEGDEALPGEVRREEEGRGRCAVARRGKRTGARRGWGWGRTHVALDRQRVFLRGFLLTHADANLSRRGRVRGRHGARLVRGDLARRRLCSVMTRHALHARRTSVGIESRVTPRAVDRCALVFRGSARQTRRARAWGARAGVGGRQGANLASLDEALSLRDVWKNFGTHNPAQFGHIPSLPGRLHIR